MTELAISLSEYAARRRKLRAALGKSTALVFAGDHAPGLDVDFRPHPHFQYLTGVIDEPGAVLMLDPAHPTADRRAALFLRPRDPEVERWDGARPAVDAALRKRTGIKAIFRTGHLPRLLGEAARRSRTLACVHPLANHDQPLSPDLAVFRRLAERVPGLTITDATEHLARMRSVKSRPEIALIRRAVEITAAGFAAAMKTVAPGRSEFEVQEALEHAYRTRGSRGPAFGTIAGSGFNSTVLHYRGNHRTIEAGDLVCIDSGAAFGGYGADVTRTVPASGRFSKRQAEVYAVVLRALNAAAGAVRPGVTIAAIDAAARAIIGRAGYGDAFIHGIGHHLGLETHDITPDGPLRVGAVITVEPGIYLPEQRLGIRIEDDVLVTATGCRNLSAKIPRTIAAIEKAMRS